VDADGEVAWRALRAAEKTSARLRWQAELTADKMLDAAEELSADKSSKFACGSADYLHVAAARRLNWLNGIDEFWTCDTTQRSWPRRWPPSKITRSSSNPSSGCIWMVLLISTSQSFIFQISSFNGWSMIVSSQKGLYHISLQVFNPEFRSRLNLKSPPQRQRRFREASKTYHWLSAEQLKAALGYYATYPKEIDGLIEQNEQWNDEKVRDRYPFTRSFS
jgi:hypothetical protein